MKSGRRCSHLKNVIPEILKAKFIKMRFDERYSDNYFFRNIYARDFLCTLYNVYVHEYVCIYYFT